MRFFMILMGGLLVTALLGGCSNIGKVNGVDVARVAGGNPNPTFCQKNPTTCIIAGVAVVGGTTLVIREITKDNKNKEVVPGGIGAL